MKMKPDWLFPSKPTTTCSALSILALFILTLATLQHCHGHPHHRNPGNADRFHRAFLCSASNATLAAYLRALTLHPHVAEPSLDGAHLVQSHFESFGLETHVACFTPLLSYPIRGSLMDHFSNGTSVNLSLIESRLALDVVVPYHVYSPSGWVVRVSVVRGNRHERKEGS